PPCVIDRSSARHLIFDSCPTRRSSDLLALNPAAHSIRQATHAKSDRITKIGNPGNTGEPMQGQGDPERSRCRLCCPQYPRPIAADRKSTRLNSSPRFELVCRLLLEKKN